MACEEAVLETIDLTKLFDNRPVVDRVSLRIMRGKTLGIAGESGGGKTTLAYMLARLIEPTTGQILLDGKDWLSVNGRELRRARRKIQIVFQDPYSSLNPVMTIREIVEEPLLIAGWNADSRRRRAFELLDQVQLGFGLSERRPAELSGGQRQRVAIARAIALNPEIVIADEPVSSLDPKTRDAVMSLLMELAGELGHTLVLIGHDLDVVRSACAECAVMWRGRLVEQAATAKLFRRALHPYTQLLLAAAAMKDEPALESGPIPDLREVEPGHWAAS